MNAIGRCQLCGSMRQTAHVKFERNVGMLVLRQTRRLEPISATAAWRRSFGTFRAKICSSAHGEWFLSSSRLSTSSRTPSLTLRRGANSVAR